MKGKNAAGTRAVGRHRGMFGRPPGKGSVSGKGKSLLKEVRECRACRCETGRSKRESCHLFPHRGVNTGEGGRAKRGRIKPASISFLDNTRQIVYHSLPRREL